MLNKLLRIISSILEIVFIGGDSEEFMIHRKKIFCSKLVLFKRYHKFCCEKILYQRNASIPEETTILGKIVFPHGLNGILLSKGAVIGDNCTLFQHVTVGSNMLKDSKKPGSPILGGNVYVGAGAKIIGRIRIGNNVRIGANCVVVDDVPDNCTVVMNKPRIIIHNKIKDNNFVPWEQL